MIFYLLSIYLTREFVFFSKLFKNVLFNSELDPIPITVQGYKNQTKLFKNIRKYMKKKNKIFGLSA